MSDYIKREDAIEAVASMPTVGNEVINMLEALPSADADWIPCSERLPNGGQGVIVTVDDNAYKIKVGSCIYSGGTFHSLYNDLNVIAWMPLPKPYKGGDDE